MAAGGLGPFPPLCGPGWLATENDNCVESAASLARSSERQYPYHSSYSQQWGKISVAAFIVPERAQGRMRSSILHLWQSKYGRTFLRFRGNEAWSWHWCPELCLSLPLLRLSPRLRKTDSFHIPSPCPHWVFAARLGGKSAKAPPRFIVVVTPGLAPDVRHLGWNRPDLRSELDDVPPHLEKQ